MQTVSVVIPALNERENMHAVIQTIPLAELGRKGWDVEILVVDNGSTDGTGIVARELGARVLIQPVRGYGNAYKAGFANSTGHVIATGDADCTYPFEALPVLLDHLTKGDFDFLTTNRMATAKQAAMKPSHVLGNRGLSAVSRALFRTPFQDSQSGMWIFRRDVWQRLDVRSGGMGFSQELKHEAFLKGFRVDEVPIDYHKRGGTVKLSATKDGMANAAQLVAHRIRTRPHGLANLIGLRHGTLASEFHQEQRLARTH